MPKSSRKPLRKWETPSPSALFAEHMPALIGDSVTVDICFRSATITAPTIIFKMGWLTFPISGYQHYGFPCTTQIVSSRNSRISLVPHYYRNPFTLWISDRFVSNLHPTTTSWTNGCLWVVLAFQKHRWHWQNHGVIRTQSATFTNMVLLWTSARKLEEEAWYQKDSADSLLVELWKLGIDEVLHPLIAEARWLDRRAMHFAQPASPITIQRPAHAPTLPTDTTTNYSTEQDTGGPSRPIVIVNDDTTTPPTTLTSSSEPPFKKQWGTPFPRWTSSYVRRKRQATPNLGSSGLERG